jgi:hypothetical protein
MCSLRGIGKGNEVGAAMVTERTKGGTRADRRSEAIFLERKGVRWGGYQEEGA